MNDQIAGPYVVCKLSDYRLQLYATRDYLDKNPTICTLSDLADHRFIGYVDEMIYSSELRYLDKLANSATVVLRSTSIVAQMTAVRSGKGLAVLPSFMVNAHAEFVAVLPGIADLVRTFWLIVPVERREIARVRTVCDFLRETMNINRAFFMGETDKVKFLQPNE